jgi:hypothetical protein
MSTKGKTHYFIVSYNTSLDEWELDAEAEQDFFPQGTILDHEQQEWFRDYDGDGVFHPDAERLGIQITKAISQLNKGLKTVVLDTKNPQFPFGTKEEK